MNNQKWAERFRMMLIVVLSIIFLISAGVLITTMVRGENEQNAFETLAQEVAPQEQAQQGENPLEGYQDLKVANEDFVGWISLEGTMLNYPVMYTPDDPQYYLRRDFEKQSSLSGTPFIDAKSSPTDANVLIHGHNMKNGTMFNVLMQYEDEQFWTSHPVIQFHTLSSLGDYQVLGVFFIKVSGDPEKDEFPYYEYAHIADEAQFEEYVARVKEMALYETGVDAAYGDQLITLSTCDNVTDDGRVVVVAVKPAAQTAQESAKQEVQTA